VLVDCPRLRELQRELRRQVEDAFNSVSSLLGGSNEGEKCIPDTISRAKTVNAVLDFAEASQRFRSCALRVQPNNGSGKYATTNLDEALSSFSGSGRLYMYVLGYIVVVACISLWRGVIVNGTIIIIILCTRSVTA
jgi:hypothetical protein